MTNQLFDQALLHFRRVFMEAVIEHKQEEFSTATGAAIALANALHTQTKKIVNTLPEGDQRNKELAAITQAFSLVYTGVAKP